MPNGDGYLHEVFVYTDGDTLRAIADDLDQNNARTLQALGGVLVTLAPAWMAEEPQP